MGAFWSVEMSTQDKPPPRKSSAGLSTFRQRARAEIEIGMWGSVVTAVLFFVSGVADYFSEDDLSWISALGCVAGIATIALIVVRARISDSTLRARKALRKLRSERK